MSKRRCRLCRSTMEKGKLYSALLPCIGVRLCNINSRVPPLICSDTCSYERICTDLQKCYRWYKLQMNLYCLLMPSVCHHHCLALALSACSVVHAQMNKQTVMRGLHRDKTLHTS